MVADACWSVDVVDLRGRRWPAEDVHALSLANLHGEYAEVVSFEDRASPRARGAKLRQRLRAARR